jgi:hypothetical protein
VSSFIDPASDAIRQVQKAELEKLSADWTPEDDTVEELTESPYKKFFVKIRPSWRTEDRNALQQLRAAADQLILETYDDALKAIDKIYLAVRVPVFEGDTPKRIDGRILWEVDKQNKPVEKWALLSNHDLEASLFELQKLKLVTSQKTSQLFLEAVFAKHTYNDFWHEAYESMIEGTAGDRNARANREARNDKYHAFFRYYLWARVDSFDKELANMMRLLERLRDWRN